MITQTQTPTLYALYRLHVDEQRDELETVLKAQKLFPKNWQSIYSLMNETIKKKELQNDYC